MALEWRYQTFKRRQLNGINWSSAARAISTSEVAGAADKGDIRRLKTFPRNLPFVHQAFAADRSSGFGTQLPFATPAGNDGLR